MKSGVSIMKHKRMADAALNYANLEELENGIGEPWEGNFLEAQSKQILL